jgi:hypothetical protein
MLLKYTMFLPTQAQETNIWEKLRKEAFFRRELYAHDAHTSGLQCNDKPNGCFDDYENTNLATDAAHAADVKMLSQKLHAIVAAQFDE